MPPNLLSPGELNQRRTPRSSGVFQQNPPIVAVNAFRMDVRFGEAAIVERTVSMGAK
jgi:hypothetical protein